MKPFLAKVKHRWLLLPVLTILCFSITGCTPEVPDQEITYTYKDQLKKYGTQSCRRNGKWGIKCVRNHANNCKVLSECQLISTKALCDYFPDCDSLWSDSNDLAATYDFQTYLYARDPQLYMHPDSVTY